MRRFIILTMVIFGFLRLNAQNALPTFTVSPSEIDALTENVTITFDVTGSAVAGLTDVYIWSWSPQLNPSEMLLCYEGASANWGSISPNAKLEPVAGNANKFKLTLPKTVTRAGATVTFHNIAELFGVGDTPGKIKEFGFLLRSQDGSKQTLGDLATKISLLPLQFEASYFRTFPSKVSVSDVVTAYLNLSKIESGEDPKLSIADSIKADISLVTSTETIVLTITGIKTSYTPEKEYAFTFLPKMLGTLPTGTSITDVVKGQVVFSGKVYSQSGSSEVVKTKTFTIPFQPYK